jgi:hypothetical protein
MEGAPNMMQVGIAELRARLSEYLIRVQEGEEIVVAEGGDYGEQPPPDEPYRPRYAARA